MELVLLLIALIVIAAIVVAILQNLRGPRV